jgi:excisionase family DNA binding protein
MENWLMLVSLAQAAKELAVSIHGLGRWVAERRISVVRLGRRVLIKREDLDEFIEKNWVPAREDRR